MMSPAGPPEATDSAKVAASPGDQVDLTATVAPDAAAAAEVYPAAYWYSMIDLPTEDELANISGGMTFYLMWIKNMGCIGCHQLGQLSTRTIPEEFSTLGTSHEAWIRRLQSGQAGRQMVAIAAGQLPWKKGGPWAALFEPVCVRSTFFSSWLSCRGTPCDNYRRPCRCP